MTIAVIGLGFVGLTTSLGFSHKGWKVIGYDIDPQRVKCLRQGEVPFFEPGLKEELGRQQGKNFFLTDNLTEAVSQSEVVFYCVGTPSMDDGRADLTYLKAAVVNSLSQVSNGNYKVLVIKSTVPPGTTSMEIAPLIKERGFTIGRDIGLANNPEFLREGRAFEDFIAPDRIVIGQSDERSGTVVEDLYRSFGAPVFKVSFNTGEFIKYLSNTMLATMISFSNEMSMIADAIGDVHTVDAFRILQLDKRWSGQPGNMTSYVYPGCGFGGSCLPKDTRALVQQAKTKRYVSSLLREVLDVNYRIKDFVVKKIAALANAEDSIGILGLAFKPNSDDVRETPSYDIIQSLKRQGYHRIVVYDPMAIENFRKTYGNGLDLQYAASFEDVVARSEVLVILTAWSQFAQRQGQFKDKKVLDFRYMLDRPKT